MGVWTTVDLPVPPPFRTSARCMYVVVLVDLSAWHMASWLQYEPSHHGVASLLVAQHKLYEGCVFFFA